MQFGAAAQRATVWLNGKRLGEHEGGFTPFAFEVTGVVRPRDNSIVVKVDNTRRADALPALNTDWWNYGGLTRGVRLVETPRVFVRDAVVQLAKENTSVVRASVRLDGARAPVKVTVEIPEVHAGYTTMTDDHGNARFEFGATLAPWSPETPRLYDVVIRTGDDRVQDRVGFRTVATRGPDILLNGKPIFLRGISLHEEALGRGGRATTRAQAEALLNLAKELGCNFVRLAHYPHGDEMTRAADRLGLLVWSEIPVYWTIAWSNVGTLATARAQLAEEIARDHNRASVILWSVGNETPVSEARNQFLRTLVEDVRAADDTRLVTAALEHRAVDARTHVLDDPLGVALDVLGLNEYVGWYDGLPGEVRHAGLAVRLQQTDHRQRIRGRREGRPARRRADAVLGGIPGRRLPPSDRHAEEDPVAARPVAVDPGRLPLAAAPAARRAGRVEPQGPGRRRRHEEAGVRRAARRLPRVARPCAGGRCRAMMRRRMSRSIVAASLLVVLAAGCAPFDPPPPAPIRPTDRNVVVAWTIEEGLYDNGLARATEIIQFRYQGGADDGVTEIQDYGRLYRGDQRPRKPTIYRRHLTSQEMEQLQHVLAALELPDLERRQEKPELVPWTMWGIASPSRAHAVLPAAARRMARRRRRAQLFGLLESYRRDARLHPDAK